MNVGPRTCGRQPGDAWEALPLPAMLLDAEGRVAALNEAAESWLNLSRRTIVGQLLEGEAVAARLRLIPSVSSLLDRLAAGHDTLIQPLARVEVADRSGGRVPRPATLHLGPCEDGCLSLVIVPQDGGVRPGRAAKRAARSAIGMSEMLTHEIKNPLAGIRGAAQLIGLHLAERGEDGALGELVELIVAESRRIVTLLEQVEDFGDTSPPRIEAVNLHDVLERARRTTELAFDGLRIGIDYDPSLPLAQGDSDRLVQLFMNLLRNAAEALRRRGAANGSIRLRSYYDGSLRRDGRVLPLQVEVEDDGPGIPEAIADQIFEPFVSSRENGTGLGLALVAKIVADHGGWIGVESRPGHTVFRLSLPRAADNAGGQPWTVPS